MNNRKSVALHNLGCKVNSYELDVLQQMLQENGYAIVSFDEIADIYLVNTCSVTNIADRKSRQMLHKAKKRNPQAIVVAMGCYVQMNEEESLQDEMIDLLIGNNKKKDALSIIEQYCIMREQEEVTKTLNHTTIINMDEPMEYEEMKRKQTGSNLRANVKIQDGCNQFCTYCIIPYARGRVRSRKIEDILEEVKQLVQNGYQEVVLTGIHISSYGIDLEADIALFNVIEMIHQIEGLERIRIGSLEPRIITESFVRGIRKLHKVCPHFHLSLQSGSDSVLKRMNRRYTSGEYYEKVKLLRKYLSYPAITTDLIVGFPGETKEEYEETIRFVEEVKFAEVHVFKYSKRKGTKAAVMPEQVADQVKALRSETLIALTKQQARSYEQGWIGQEVWVLWEEVKVIEDKEYKVGYTKEYCKVAIPHDNNGINQIDHGVVKGHLTEGIMELYKN
ncbi:MAG: tRNA (N(6)-L-threonylcarbamoyladenosine(37)-C(2))-methylthiotransferase MtaB [Eubacteriales bacterium]